MMNNYKDHLWVAILAGGGGTRLWPLSREKNPKQFIKLFENKTLLQTTAQRLSKLVPWGRMFVVTTSHLYGREVEKELPRLPVENILVEPTKRGTAVAHGLAAIYISRLDPDAVILNESADHEVSPVKDYLKCFNDAAKVAYEKKSLVAIGIAPAYPHTGMGHIKIGKIDHRVDGRVVYKVEKFIEKPPLVLARRFTKSGDYLWNGNLYVWRADTILDSIKAHSHKIGNGLTRISDSIGSGEEREVLAHVYKSLPNISIDYAVSEKEKNFLAIKADFSWYDVGDWNVVWQLTKKDDKGNAIIHLNGKGEWIPIKTQNTLVQTDKLLVATVGVKDLVIIETDDAILIADQSKAQLVKDLVNKLKEKDEKDLL
ncbi:mannose-1-phosphate guanylyltransferase [Candidatus Microgenomates bacterium]|nr:mannose-1-phosphate guanylyltransferase [Candidatus Microgenomates bacterium]